jgi:hypothetical protein
MLLPKEAPLLGLHVSTGGLHLVVEPGDAGQGVRRLFRARSGRFVELPPHVSPAAHLDNALFFEELIVAAVGVSMNISSMLIEKIQRTPLAAIDGEIVGRKRRVGPSQHIDPQSCLLELSVPLDLQGNAGVVGKQDVTFQNGPPEDGRNLAAVPLGWDLTAWGVLALRG